MLTIAAAATASAAAAALPCCPLRGNCVVVMYASRLITSRLRICMLPWKGVLQLQMY
jgi:hypothetical protein